MQFVTDQNDFAKCVTVLDVILNGREARIFFVRWHVYSLMHLALQCSLSRKTYCLLSSPSVFCACVIFSVSSGGHTS